MENCVILNKRKLKGMFLWVKIENLTTVHQEWYLHVTSFPETTDNTV